MKNYKNKTEDDGPYCDVCGGCGYIGCDGIKEFLNKHVKGKTNCKNEAGFLSEIESYCESDSLPDQEPKDFPEVSRKAFTCRHDFKVYDELDKESITVYCNKCGTTVDGAKLMLPAAYAKGIDYQEPKDLPKLPEKLEIDSLETPWTLMPVIKAINQILDWLNNNK